MKSSTKVIAKSHAAKTISVVRELSSTAFINTPMYKLIHNEVLGYENAVEARRDIFTKYYLPLVPTKSVRGKSVMGAVDTKSPQYAALTDDIIKVLRSVYMLKSHTIDKGKENAIKLDGKDAAKLKVIAAFDMTEKEVRALPETDDKVRIRKHALDWVKKTRQRYFKSFEVMLEVLRNPVAKPKAKSKAKSKGKVDLANKGKGITAEQVIALMINGCAKLNKDKAEAYLDKLAEQLEALRNNVMSGKPVLECEA